jgi:hypothetical protein
MRTLDETFIRAFLAVTRIAGSTLRVKVKQPVRVVPRSRVGNLRLEIQDCDRGTKKARVVGLRLGGGIMRGMGQMGRMGRMR